MPSNWPIPDGPPAADRPGLYVVTTPIGHLEDITLRALRVLTEVELIAAEDTRHTGQLLKAHGIINRLTAYHEHNERRRAPELIAKLNAGQRIALVSDAGTPTVSDPGYRLVRLAIDEKIDVIPIPGVSAAVTALSVSGLATDRFTFIGFPTRKKGQRRTLLESLAACHQTLIFYQSPQRLTGFLKELRHIMGDRQAVVGREMTKRYEEFIRGPLSDIIAALAGRDTIKGECTVLVAGRDPDAPVAPDALQESMRRLLAEGRNESASLLARAIADRLHIPRRQAYEQVLQWRRRKEDGHDG